MPSAWSAERELMLDVGGDKFEIGARTRMHCVIGAIPHKIFREPTDAYRGTYCLRQDSECLFSSCL